MPEAHPGSTDTPASLALDLAYVISNAARADGVRLPPATCQAIARAITDRPGLIRALARGV